jgi:hypothetical protein
VSPDVEKTNLIWALDREGVAASMAEVGMLIHFALRDLCPEAAVNPFTGAIVPKSTPPSPTYAECSATRPTNRLRARAKR